MKKTRRTSKVGDLLQQEIATIIRRDLGDWALAFVSVTGVEISTDLRFARVFVSALGEQADLAAAVTSLQKARGRIKHLIGQRVSLRYTPELEFHPDMTTLKASSIEKILKEEKSREGNPENDSTD